jgi:hypothetical protein
LCDQQSVKDLVEVVVHEYYGSNPLDTSHSVALFMEQRLCDVNQLEKFKCEMQKLLYKAGEGDNTTYLQHYLAAIPGTILDLVQSYMKDQKFYVENHSLASLHEIIKKVILQQCIQRKPSRMIKKQHLFLGKHCN